MHFFIDTSDQETVVQDDQGYEFADLEAAKTAAVCALPDMARDVLPDGDQRTFLAVVRDGEGRSRIRASLTLRIEHLGTPREA